MRILVVTRGCSIPGIEVAANEANHCNSAGSSWARMFWKVAGYSQPSPLEAILDMDGFSLEDVLDEADLIQECKSLNGRLVNFLREPSTVRSLLSYLVDLPGPGLHPCSSPHLACQLSHTTTACRCSKFGSLWRPKRKCFKRQCMPCLSSSYMLCEVLPEQEQLCKTSGFSQILILPETEGMPVMSAFAGVS